MSQWLYYGHRDVRKNGSTITLPPVLFREGIISSYEGAGVYWFIQDEEMGIAGSAVPEIDFQKLTESQTHISLDNGSKITTIPKLYLFDEDGERRFDAKETVHFVATESMVEGESRSCCLLTTEQLVQTIESPDSWVRSPENIQRLFEFLEVEGLESIFPTEIFADNPDMGGYTLSYTDNPGKGGVVEVETDLPERVRTRWFKYRDGMNTSETDGEIYLAIESEFEVESVDEKLLTQVGTTRQFTVRYFKDVDDWVKEEDKGDLDHVPRAVRQALGKGGWQVAD